MARIAPPPWTAVDGHVSARDDCSTRIVATRRHGPFLVPLRVCSVCHCGGGACSLARRHRLPRQVRPFRAFRRSPCGVGNVPRSAASRSIAYLAGALTLNSCCRSGAASLWCPEAVLAEGLDPVLQSIMKEGPHAYGDSGVPENTPPPWMDRKRFAAGQRLTQAYPLALVFAHIQALYMVMAVPSVLDVLVYTGNSDTPDEAWDR